MSRPSTRRELLRAGAGLAAAAGLAGCVGSGTGTDTETRTSPTDTPDDHDSGHSHSDDDDTDTDPDTDTSSPTPTPAVEGLVSRSFESVDTSCGEGVNEATISFSEGANRLTVDVRGTIRGPDTCQVAVLERAGRAPDDDSTFRIRVGVETESPPGETPVCGQCIVDVQYRASFEFEGNLPGTVTVAHETAENNPVATKRR